MIKMIGIDHTTASVDIRALFSVKKSEMKKEMETIKQALDLSGIVLLNTCNRMEIWVSGQDSRMDILGALCNYKGIDKNENETYFVCREEEEAITHLMMLAGGLKSAIMGEDQILTQVKQGIDFSRQERLSDSTLDVLFRTAITAAKKIKSEVVFHRANASAIEQALVLLQEKGMQLCNMKCLVIGNGEYGRMVANRLVACGADVTVTIRQYHSGEVLIPKGCKTILYGDKYTVFPFCDLVVSATTSPNFTITYDKVRECNCKSRMILLDLAVPRDVEPRIKDLPGFQVFDIDCFQSDLAPGNEEAFEQAEAIIREKIKEFHLWYDYKDMVPLINNIKKNAVEDIDLRLHKTITKLNLQDEVQEDLKEHIDDAAGKVIGNLFYHMRDVLGQDDFKKCMKAIWEYENG